MRTLVSIMIVLTSAAGAVWAAGALPVPQGPAVAPLSVQPTYPTATVNLNALSTALAGSMAGVPALVQLSGENVGLGGLPTLTASSTLYARVMTINSSGQVAPAGTYQVRFNVTNVGAASALTLIPDAGGSVVCTLAARPGYANVQSCDVSATTSGAALTITARGLTGVPQLELLSVQVFKIR